MKSKSPGTTALFLTYIASFLSYAHSDRTNNDDYPLLYDISDTYRDVEEAPIMSLADFLETKGTALEFQEWLNNKLKQRRQKKSRCNIGTGGTSCNAEAYTDAHQIHQQLMGMGSPGRRRRRQIYEDETTN